MFIHGSPVWGQSGHDPHARRSASEASSKAERMATELEGVRLELDRVLMITEALWSFLADQGHSEDELVRRITAIDLRDGRLDGKVGKQPVQDCPECARPLSRRRQRCLYCGAEVVIDPFRR